MSSTSRVLRPGEAVEVTPLWWQDSTAAPPVHAAPQRAEATEDGPTIDLELQRAERASYQRGFSEGSATGREQAAAELQPVLDRLSRSLAELATLRARVRKDAEGDLLKLAVAIARRVLHRELTLDPQSIEGVIRVAMEKLEGRELCRVHVYPDQEATVRALLARFPGAQKIELVPDPALQCGDVTFETPHGVLDASVEAQLAEIERGFADRLKR